jgi:hypothetical protein
VEAACTEAIGTDGERVMTKASAVVGNIDVHFVLNNYATH